MGIPIDVSEHQGLLVNILKRYAKWASGRGVSWDDLLQEGNLAMVRAAKLFDPEQGKWSTYAARAVKNAARQYVQEQAGDVRVPRHIHDKAHADGVTAPFQSWEASASELLQEEPDEHGDSFDRARDGQRTKLAEELMRCLTPMQQLVIRWAYHDDRPMSELADSMGFCRQRVQQIRSEAISAMREAACGREIP